MSRVLIQNASGKLCICERSFPTRPRSQRTICNNSVDTAEVFSGLVNPRYERLLVCDVYRRPNSASAMLCCQGGELVSSDFAGAVRDIGALGQEAFHGCLADAPGPARDEHVGAVEAGFEDHDGDEGIGAEFISPTGLSAIACGLCELWT